MLFGFWIAGQLTNAFALSTGGHEWRTIWLYPAGFAIVVAVLFALMFKNEVVARQSPTPKGSPVRSHG
jgi:hypothetical protein